MPDAAASLLNSLLIFSLPRRAVSEFIGGCEALREQRAMTMGRRRARQQELFYRGRADRDAGVSVLRPDEPDTGGGGVRRMGEDGGEPVLPVEGGA